MNKKAMSLILLGSLLYSFSFAEELSLFTKAKINQDSIGITFRERGIRYHIELNGKYLGINDYGQILTIKKPDTLKLAEKHFSYVITYMLKDGQNYLRIEEVGYDHKTGKNVSKEHFIKLIADEESAIKINQEISNLTLQYPIAMDAVAPSKFVAIYRN